MQTWTTVEDRIEKFGRRVEGEPDKAQWVAHGLDCMMKRQPDLGHWCGYVGVPPDHPLHGIDYASCVRVASGAECDEEFCYEHSPQYFLDAHGGITFSDDCHDPTREEWERTETDLPFEEWKMEQMPRRICHIPEKGRPEDVWWFGFDCGHLGDMSPGMDRRVLGRGVYRYFSYVREQTEELARQLAEIDSLPVQA